MAQWLWVGRTSGKLLDYLFTKLAAATAEESEVVEHFIWACWAAHADPEVRTAMASGANATQAGNYTAAVEHYSDAIARDGSFAEAYNGRATARVSTGQSGLALVDIDSVLRHEPRHFGALVGGGTTLLAFNKFTLAHEWFEI